ncbi:MAG: translocation/assembly module TamB domain-containing protein [Candidatus Kryptonium sp.]|nr:translocation/assembly module TamB [Candidatus Kryptonium sp.]MDW8109092.1 translocation/assembly module TamB domain-containing protein [Candidatus Kryptonium sp.]
MKRFLKKFFKATFYFFALLFILISIVLIISQTEKFRSILHSKVESELKKLFGEEIHLGKFYGNIFTGFGVDGFHIKIDGKTFIKALGLELKYNPIGLIKGGYSFRELILYKPEVYLIRGKDGKWNFQKVFKPGEKREGVAFSFSCEKLVIDDGKFALFDSINTDRSRLADSLNCINYHNFVVHDINAVLSGRYSSEKIDLRKINLSFVVDTGKFTAKINGKIYADKNRLKAEDFDITTGNSKVKFDFTAVTRDNLFKLNIESLEKVLMNLSLRADSFSFAELTKFIPYVHFLSGSPSVEIDAVGTLESLKVKGIKIKIYDSDIFVSGELKNIIRFPEFQINADVSNTKIKISDISKFVTLVRLPTFGAEYVDVEGQYIGHPLEFNSKLNLKLGASSIDLEGNFKIKDNLAYNLTFNVSGLNPYDIFEEENLNGILNFSGNLTGEGVKFETMSSRATLNIGESLINKVLIPKSSFWIELKNSELNGSFVSVSEGFKGVIDLNLKKLHENEYQLSLSGSLSELDISQIRIDKPHFLRSYISGDFNANVLFGKVSRMEFFAQLNPSLFGNYKISRLRLSAKYIDDVKKYLLVQSNMFDLNFEGEFDFASLAKSMIYALGTVSGNLKEKLNFSTYEKFNFAEIKNPVYAEYKLKLKNLTPISLFSIGQLFQSVGNINGVFLADSQGFYFYSDASLKQIRYTNYERNKIDTFEARSFNGSIEISYNRNLRFRVRGDLNGFVSSWFELSDVKLNLNYDEPELYAEVSSVGDKWKFESVSVAQFSPEVNRYILKMFNADIHDNKIYLIDEIEIFQTKSSVIINPSSLTFNDQEVYIAGFIDKETQQLRVWGENIKLNKIFLKGSEFQGNVNFSISVYGTHDKPNSEIEVFIDDLRYKDVQAGKLQCFGKIENDMIRLNSMLVATAGDLSYNAMDISISFPMWISPDVRTKYQEPYISGKIRFLRFPIAIFETVIGEISDLKGDVTADIDLSGTFDKPNFRGKFSLQNCIFKFNQNSKYYLVYGTGRVDSNVIYFEDFNLWNNPDDYRDGEVQIKGRVYLDRFAIASGEFNINGRLLLMDKEGFGSTGLYGRVIAETGKNGLVLKVDTTGLYLNGEVLLSDVNLNYFPRHAGGMMQSTGFEYVYVSPMDTIRKEEIATEELVYLDIPVRKNDGVQNETTKKNGAFSELNYDLKISTLKDAKLNVILNAQTGEEFYAEFTGNLNLRHYSGSTIAYGEINILDRSYYNFFRRFNATGKLKFTGNLENPEIDIIANYTGTHTVLTDTLSAGKVETILVQLLISGTLSRPIVKIQMFVDGEDYQKVYPHGEVESDAISFLVTGRFKDELTRGEVTMFTENLWSSTGAGLLSNVVSGVMTDILRDVLGGVITSTEIGYYGGFRGLRITGNIGGAIVQIGGDIFTDISRSVVVVQYPLLRKFLGGSLTVEYQRKPVQFYQEKEILNKLGLYYRIRL